MSEAVDKLTERLIQWAAAAEQAISSGQPNPELGASLRPLLEEMNTTLQQAHAETGASLEAAVEEGKKRAAARAAARAARAAAQAEQAAAVKPEPAVPFDNGTQFLNDQAIKHAVRDLLERAPAPLPADAGDEVWQMESADWQVARQHPKPSPAAKPHPPEPKPKHKKKTDDNADLWDLDSTDWSSGE